MALNIVFIVFFLLSFLIAIIKTFFFHDYDVFDTIIKSTIDMSKSGFEISLYLTGALSLWMGIMKIGENGGAINILTRLTAPLFTRLFPDVPKNHPAYGSIMMNFTANMLGLDNAATPAGLKAMGQLQEINPDKEKASNAQIMFMVINASGLTIIPVSIITIRAQMLKDAGSSFNPTDIFIPVLIATFFSTLGGILLTSFIQKIKFDKVIIAYLGGAALLVVGLLSMSNYLTEMQLQIFSKILSSSILFSIIVSFIIMALRKRVNVYDSFIEGAKDGFNTAIKIVPYLIAILVAIGVFRASGGMDWLQDGIKYSIAFFAPNADLLWVDAIPTAIMKPLSGSGARGMMVETMKTFGPESFQGFLSCIFQGAADTTFFILAVYFGSIGIKKTRYALGAALFADLCGVIAAIVVAYIFYPK